MLRDRIRKYLPPPEAIRRQKTLRAVRHLLSEPALWHLHRRSAGGAVFIGLFCAFLPLPIGQMPIAALLAVLARCNLPIAIALVWVTNPLTFGPLFYFAYKLGAWLLGVDAVGAGWELSWGWLWERMRQIWWPLLLGSLVCGWVAGLTGSVLARLLWRLHVIRRWRERRAARRERRSSLRRSAKTRPGSSPSP